MNTDLTTADDDTAASAEVEAQKQPLTLTVDIQHTGSCQRHVSVSIPREDIERYFQKQFDELAPKAEVPGFRPGRAPRKLVESKFRRQVSDQVKGALIMDALSQLVDEQRFAAISEPDLNYEIVKIPDEGPLTFEFDIEVRPDFELPQWKGLQLEVSDATVSDDDMEEIIKVYQDRFSDTAAADGPVQTGDIVTVNIRVRHHGVLVHSLDEVELTVRPKLTFHDGELDGFDKLLVGTALNETRTAKVELHTDGTEGEEPKVVDVEFLVLDVKRRQPIPVDELAERLEFESVEAMRQALATSLARRKEYARRQEIRNAISSLLVESANWELPPALVKKQFRRELDRTVMELQSSGFSEEEINRRENMIRRNARRRTEVALKEHFILERIAEVEKVTDEPADYDIEIARIAEATGESERRVRSKLDRSGQMDALRNMIIEQKVIDLITQHAHFRTKPRQPPDEGGEVADLMVEAADFGLWSRPESNIPEAKYEENPATPIPGQSPRTSPSGIDR